MGDTYNELRPVLFERFYNQLNETVKADNPHGRFHKWAMTYLDNNQEITVAIIEGQDGKVYRVPTDYLSFKDTDFHKVIDDVLDKEQGKNNGK